MKYQTKCTLIATVVAVLYITLLETCSCSKREDQRFYFPNSHADKDLELLANVIRFEKKEYSASDMCIVFRKGDKYEYEWPKSHIQWILMNLRGKTNETNYSSIEAGHYIDLGSFQMHFDDGYSCVSFPEAKTADELSNAIIDYLVKLLNTASERRRKSPR